MIAYRCAKAAVAVLFLFWSDPPQDRGNTCGTSPTGPTADSGFAAVRMAPGRARENCLADRCCKSRDSLFGGQVC